MATKQGPYINQTDRAPKWEKREHDKLFELLKIQSMLEHANSKVKLKGNNLWDFISKQMDEHGYTRDATKCYRRYMSHYREMSEPGGKWVEGGKWIVGKIDAAKVRRGAPTSKLRLTRALSACGNDTVFDRVKVECDSDEELFVGGHTPKRPRLSPEISNADRGGSGGSNSNTVGHLTPNAENPSHSCTMKLIDLEEHSVVRSLFPAQDTTSQEAGSIAVQIQKFEAQIEELRVTDTYLTHDISVLNETLARAQKERDSKQAELDAVRRKGKALLRVVEALAHPDLAL